MLELKNIHIEFEDFKLQNINISVGKGEYFALLGVSGSGKSVILETIAGMIKAQKGQIILNKKDITNEKIQYRNVGLVFQDFAIFPNMNIKENLSYPLHCKKKPRQFIKQKIDEISALVNIQHLLNRNPATLSGGELQRVALGRVLALEPQILLLDEPLSSIDTQLKNEIQSLLRKINRKGQTIIHVTHNYLEAISLANRISVINNGTIEQTGTAKEIFHNPKSKFIASFTGIKNFYNAHIIGQNEANLENKVVISLPIGNYKKNGFITFRTKDIILSLKSLDSSMCNQLQGTIVDFIPQTEGVEVVIDAKIKIVASITHASVRNLNLTIGSKVWVGFKATAVKYIPRIDQ